MQDNIPGKTVVISNSEKDTFVEQIEDYEKKLRQEDIDPETLAQTRLNLIQNAKRAIRTKTSSEATCWYGYSLVTGDNGFPLNLTEGIKLLTEAALMQSKKANMYLGNIYSNWLGFIPENLIDYKKAVKHYEQDGSGYSHYRLANIYANHSTLKDLRKALNSIEKSAIEYNHVRGKCLLAYWTFHGEFVSQNFEEAYNLFKQVIEKDNEKYDDFGQYSQSLAMFYMGMMLYNGLGIPCDEQKGLEMIEDAAAFGDSDALEWLENYYNHM